MALLALDGTCYGLASTRWDLLWPCLHYREPAMALLALDGTCYGLACTSYGLACTRWDLLWPCLH